MVYCLGETLLDIFVKQDGSNTQAAVFMPDEPGIPGGAMLNTAVSVARSGIPVSLVTELGDDDKAAFILRFLKKNNVQLQGIRQYPQMETSVALAVLDQNKKASYTFQKHYPPLRHLMPLPSFTAQDILLFGSLYSLEDGIRKDLLKYLHAARQAGSTIIYDPNIRQDKISHKSLLWQKVNENLNLADVIKASDEDLTALFGALSPERLLASLREINPRALTIMTRGASGLLCGWEDEIISLPATKIEVKSTVGAGDGFNAGLIHGWVKQGYTAGKLQTLNRLSAGKLLEYGVSFASAICASDENYIPLGWRSA